MINRFLNKYEKALSLIMCLVIGLNCSILRVYATEKWTDDDSIIVVSLGDSYSSGEGIEPFYEQYKDITEKVKNPDWLAHRSIESWPGKVKIDGLDGQLRDHRTDGHWFFVASSGATTDNLLKTQINEYDRDGCSGKAYLDPQLSVFDDLKKDSVDYVTLTFGGNDAGFADIIMAGVTSVPYINQTKLTDLLNETWIHFETKGGIKDSIERAYKNIHEKAGDNAKIIVAGYPKLLDKNGKGVFFTKSQATEINENVTKFNKAIEKIVNDCHDKDHIKIYFVSVEEKFDGHEAYSEDAYINKIIFGSMAQDLKKIVISSAYSIHPNKEGAEIYAEVVTEKIKEIESGNDVKEKMEEEVNKQFDKALDRLAKKLVEWLNQWLKDSCSEC